MTRYARIEASRLARHGRDTTVAVRVDREPGDGVRLAKAALAAQRTRTGLRAVMDAEFRAHMRKKLGPVRTYEAPPSRNDDLPQPPASIDSRPKKRSTRERVEAIKRSRPDLDVPRVTHFYDSSVDD